MICLFQLGIELLECRVLVLVKSIRGNGAQLPNLLDALADLLLERVLLGCQFLQVLSIIVDSLLTFSLLPFVSLTQLLGSF